MLLPNGRTQIFTEFSRGGFGGGHAERILLRNVPEGSVVKRLFSELEPCSLPGGYCARALQQLNPPPAVSHALPYPGGLRGTPGHAVRVQSVLFLRRHLRETRAALKALLQ